MTFRPPEIDRMAWKGGFSGVGFSRPEFKKWLLTQKKPSYHRIVNHMTDAPYTRAPVSLSQRIRNLGNYYKNDLGWSGGPDFFSLGDGKIYLGSPLGHSIGCLGWNGNSVHIETEGRYDGKTHDYKTGPGLENWKVSAWAQAELLQWMVWELNGDRIKLHKEGKTGHNCPGVVPKDWIIARIAEAMEATLPTPAPKPTLPNPGRNVLKKGMTGGDVPVLQKALNASLVIDGDFGPKTETAVKAFQARSDLVADGIVGLLTWGALSAPVAVAPPVAPTVDVPVIPLSKMHISNIGLDMIKHFERLRLAPYEDVGALAIGYG